MKRMGLLGMAGGGGMEARSIFEEKIAPASVETLTYQN